MNLNQIIEDSIRYDQLLASKSTLNNRDYEPWAEVNQLHSRPGLIYDQEQAIQARSVEFFAFITHVADKNVPIHLKKLLTMAHNIRRETMIDSTLSKALTAIMEDTLGFYFRPNGLSARTAIQMILGGLYHVTLPECWKYLTVETMDALYNTSVFNYRIALTGPEIPDAIEHMFL